MTCPSSHGTSYTASKDPIANPTIDPDFASDESCARAPPGDQDTQALLTENAPPRGRPCEVDAILETLGRPPTVVKVATRSGATKREALLRALREEAQHIKWRLGMKTGSFEIWSHRSHIGQAQRKASTPLQRKALGHRRSRSLDEPLEATALTQDLEHPEGFSCDTSLRQRFLSDAQRRFAESSIKLQHDSGAPNDSVTEAGKQGEPHGRNSRSLPRPQLVRSISAA